MSEVKTRQVAEGKKKKKRTISKLADIFVEEDIEDVKRHIIYDVLIPGAKELTASCLNNAVNMIFLGSTAPIKTSQGVGRYTGAFKNAAKSQAASAIKKYSGYEEVGGLTKAGALDVIDELIRRNVMYEDEDITVADLYMAAGMEAQIRHTDYNWGWENLDSFEAKYDPMEESWYIKTNKPKPVSKTRR